MEVCDAILENKIIEKWLYNETNVHRNLGKKLSARQLNFDSLKSLRTHIKQEMKSIVKVNFIALLNRGRKKQREIHKK